VTVEIHCPYCHFSKKVAKEKIPAGVQWATCPRCGQRFNIHDSGALGPEHSGLGKGYSDGGAEGEASSREGAPWEKRSEIGLFRAVFGTIKEVLFAPQHLFRTLAFKGGLKEPLAFGILIGGLGSMFGFFWQVMLLSGGMASFGLCGFEQLTAGLIFIVLVVLIPLSVIMGLFCYSGIMHLLLLLVRGGKNGFEATFRVVSYSQAAQVWGLIPFFGGWVGGIWQIIVQIIGFREIHETSYVRVIFAFLIPLALLLVIGIAVLVILVVYFKGPGPLSL